MMPKKRIFWILACLIACLGGSSAIYFFQPSPNSPYLTVIGGINMFDGLGKQSVELIQAFENEFDIDFKPTYVDRLDDVPPSIVTMMEHERPFGSVVLCEEPLMKSYKKLDGPAHSRQIRIAYSMIESTRIPSRWVEKLNRYFDCVAVPDKFLIDAYRQSGVKIPIFELPLGRNFEPFLNAPLKSNRNHPFIYGSFGAGLERKNHVQLIRAFHSAFGDRSDVQLRIHCRTFETTVREEILQEIQRTQASNITLTTDSLDATDYLKLMSSIDCYVSLSKGEGFSIQPREAMALGIPVIVTDNTAQHTICQSGLVKTVVSALPEPAIYPWHCLEPLGCFYQCSLDDAVQAFLEMDRQYEFYLQKGTFAREWVSRYHFDRIRPLYQMLIHPKKVVLGPENVITSDYLMTNSAGLYQKYVRLFKESSYGN